MKTPFRWALAPLAVLALAACNRDGAELTPADETLAVAARDAGALGRIVDNAGLAQALEGVGPYTLFAPPDAALTGGDADFTDPSLKAESAALLQAHIVPGTVTRADIAAAIDAAGEGGAQMRTMGGGLITFSREGEAIVATAEGGATARLTGDEELLSNGALQPVDGLLVYMGAGAAG